MQKITLLVSVLMVLIVGIEASAKDTYVRGYTRKDGTYVKPHIRSSPDRFKSNNYGPSKRDSELMSPRARENDQDGSPNYLDTDDNNNSINDNIDPNQYRLNKRGRR